MPHAVHAARCSSCVRSAAPAAGRCTGRAAAGPNPILSAQDEELRGKLSPWRTNVDLKDRWRSLVKAAQSGDPKRAGGHLTPEQARPCWRKGGRRGPQAPAPRSGLPELVPTQWRVHVRGARDSNVQPAPAGGQVKFTPPLRRRGRARRSS